MPSTDPGFGARHSRLARGYRGADDPADPADVLAMPMVLHIPKHHPIDRFDLLSAAATAVVSLCLDERVGAGGPWHDDFDAWMDARIRKVARRARGAQWDAVQEVPGVTIDINGAQARAFVPGRVGAVDPRVRKLQIGGTELPPGPPRTGAEVEAVLWIDPLLEMTVGKCAAQVGHASMLLAAALPVETVADWAAAGFPMRVAEADPLRWESLGRAVEMGDAVAVHDAGFTEVAAGARTVIAQWVPSAQWDQTHRDG